MKLKNIPTVSIKLFTHNKDKKTFVAERSDFGTVSLLNRIYDDACDEGFCVYNPSTNVTITLVHNTVEFDNDGDVTHQTFVPIYSDLTKYPQLQGYTFVVYND